MSKKLLYRKEDRATVRRLFTLIECLTLAIATLVLCLILLT